MSQAAPAKPAPAVPRKSSRKKWYFLGAIVLLGVIGGGVMRARKAKGEVIPITTEKAIVKTITQLVTATGKVQPQTEVKISPEVPGEIVAMPVKEGDSVKKGDILVKIKPDTIQAQLEQEEAGLVAAKTNAVMAKAQLVKAQSDAKRSEDLYNKKLLSDSDYSTATTGVEVAQATYDSAMAQIKRTEGSVAQMRDELSKTVIYAPLDGTISALESEIGERVVGTGTYTGTEIMRVADLDNMELRVQVNENDIVNVKIGDHAVISIDAYPNRKFSGDVSEIASSAQGTAATSQVTATTGDVTNFLVKIRIADRDVKLRPGMSATADIETQTVENVIAIPIQSVTVRAEGGLTSEELQKKKAEDAEKKSGAAMDAAAERDAARREREKLLHVAFIKVGDTVKMQKVETGIADNTYIEVKSGIKPGDEVISGSYAAISRKLKDGSKVEIEKPKKPDDKK
jgi:HlyD family secretion protein